MHTRTSRNPMKGQQILSPKLHPVWSDETNSTLTRHNFVRRAVVNAKVEIRSGYHRDEDQC